MASRLVKAALAAGLLRPARAAQQHAKGDELEDLMKKVPHDPFENKKAVGGRKTAALRPTQHIDGQANSPSFPNQVQQADLLVLPQDPETDDRYLLVVVDLFTRRVAAIPLEVRDSRTVQLAFAHIYQTDPILRAPDRLEIDGGGEFQGSLTSYLSRMVGPSGARPFVRVGRPGRSKQQSIVEGANRVLGDAVMTLQSARELQSGREDKTWSADIEGLVAELNKRWQRSPRELGHLQRAQERSVLASLQPNLKKGRPACETADGKKTLACDLLPIGATVLVALEKSRPRGVRGDKLSGAIRSGDPKFAPERHTVENIIFTPAKQPLYRVSDLPNTLFPRVALRPVKP